MRVVTIQQPNYFPWLGFFEQIRVSDEFLLLDDVQWIRQGRQHRTPVANPGGRRQWLSLPVHGHGHRQKTIRDMRLATDLPWAKQHWQSLQSLYGKSPYFRSQLEPLLRPWLERVQGQEFLLDVLQSSLALIAEPLGLPREFGCSSYWSVRSKSSERLAALSELLQADVYYSSLGSTRYLDLAAFRPAGIRVITQRWSGLPELGNLSVLHALAQHSFTEIREALEPSPWGAFADRRGISPSILPAAVDGGCLKSRHILCD